MIIHYLSLTNERRDLALQFPSIACSLHIFDPRYNSIVDVIIGGPQYSNIIINLTETYPE